MNETKENNELIKPNTSIFEMAAMTELRGRLKCSVNQFDEWKPK